MGQRLEKFVSKAWGLVNGKWHVRRLYEKLRLKKSKGQKLGGKMIRGKPKNNL